VAIVGQPGTGKSTFARNLFQKTGGVYINTQHEDYFQGEKITFNGQEALAAAIAGQRIVWNAEPWEIRKWLLDLYLAQRKAKDLLPITVYVDEAHLVAGRGSFNFPEDGRFSVDNIIGVMCTTHRRWNLRMFWITQRPQLVDPSVFRTCRYIVAFTLAPGDMQYFHDMRVEIPETAWHDFNVVRT
jgi:ABC-type dipeptide/oligopeptide/nickel transport system ATPase component